MCWALFVSFSVLVGTFISVDVVVGRSFALWANISAMGVSPQLARIGEQLSARYGKQWSARINGSQTSGLYEGVVD